jgi:hypothetical protein
MVVGVVVPKWSSLRRCNAQPGMSMAWCQQAKLTRARVRHARTRINFGDRLQKKNRNSILERFSYQRPTQTALYRIWYVERGNSMNDLSLAGPQKRTRDSLFLTSIHMEIALSSRVSAVSETAFAALRFIEREKCVYCTRSLEVRVEFKGLVY